MNRRTALSAVIALLVIGSVLAPVAVAQSESVVQIDRDHALTEASSIERYEEEGVVTTTLVSPNVSVTIAEKIGDCGIDDGTLSMDLKSVKSDFLCLENHEDLDHKLRIFIPDDYWTPYDRADKESVRGGATADLEPIRSGNYTSVVVTAPANERVAFEIPERSQAVYYAIERTNERTDEFFGIRLTGEKEPWTRIEESSLSGSNSTVQIRGDPEKMIIQYDADSSPASESWLQVPTAENDPDAPVYRMEKEGVDDTIYVISRVSEPPTVRYKENAGPFDGLSSAIEDIKQIDDRLEDITNIKLPDLPELPSLPWSDG